MKSEVHLGGDDTKFQKQPLPTKVVGYSEASFFASCVVSTAAGRRSPRSLTGKGRHYEDSNANF